MTWLEVLLFPPYVLMRFLDEITGEAHWYRKQRRRMEQERPSLSDTSFLEAVDAHAQDQSLWVALRGAFAESIGVPPAAVRPGDRLADLWRMQWTGPDLLDVLFRIERVLGIKIPAEPIWQHAAQTLYSPTASFRDFGVVMVAALREMKPPPARVQQSQQE
jgi:hypothetical protein